MDNPIPPTSIAPPAPVSPVIPSLPLKSSLFPTFFVVLILILLGATSVFAYQNWRLNQKLDALIRPQPTPTPLPAEASAKEGDPTANWKTYTWKTLSFSFRYPSDWTYTESTPLQNVSFNTGIPSWTKMSNGGDQVYVFESLIEDQVNYENWRKQSNYLGQETIGGFPFEKYIVADMYYSLNYIYKAKDGKIIRFMVFPYDAKQYPETLKQEVNQILSTFKFTGTTTPTPTPTSTIAPTSKPKTTYVVPTSWKRVTTQSGVNLCLPPKWEVEAYDHLIFNRDEGYKPSITYITNLPYSGGSRREAYFAYWASEYPDVKQLVSVTDTDINGNSALTIYPANSSDPKTSPEGLTVVWYSAGKLWKAGLSGWNMTNTSQASFLKDFYTMISCSL